MAFQRSYSKVWWGSDNQMPGMSSHNNAHPVSLTSGGLYSFHSQQEYQHQPHYLQPQLQHQHQYQPFGGSTYHSLDLHQYKSYAGNLSRIQEVDDEQNLSKLSFDKHDSPGSLRSQDSGFSDNEEFHNCRSLSGRSAKTCSPGNKSVASNNSDMASPSSTRTVETPPTVIRRSGRSDFYTPLVNVSRRISFTSSPVAHNKNAHSPQKPHEEEEVEGATLMAQLDSMQLLSAESPSPTKQSICNESFTAHSSDNASPIKGNNPRIKRRRKVQRKPTSPLNATHKRFQKLANAEQCNNESDEDEEFKNRNSSPIPEYNNETVYLGGGPPTCSTPPPPYNNETVVLGGPLDDYHSNTFKIEEHGISPLRLHARFSGHTSTPKPLKDTCSSQQSRRVVNATEYNDALVSGHNPSVQYWLDDLRHSCEHEVMSTLQTKSIAQEAFRNLQITTNTVAKFIRQMQQKAMAMQNVFEKVERMLVGTQNVSLNEALGGSLRLLDHVSAFTHILERRSVFFADSRSERKRYEDYIDQIKMVTKDTSYSLENQHYINLESLLEDLQVLKRILLITVRHVYEKLVGILIQSIENGNCDLMLKANINMVSTLMSIDYDGFASLTDAFVQTEAVRTLLMVCLDSKLPSTRAQALRALATICCAPEPISQLGSCGGIEVIRDILQIGSPTKSPLSSSHVKRSDLERREAVSLLTQITAEWHGPLHRVDGLKDCVETVVEGLTQLFIVTECPQTLLLCSAALNNLTRMEITAHYSIMSHQTIYKLIETLHSKDDSISVFLYEQIVAMLHNMSLNKKCHSHLANGNIINFITYAYQTEFYKIYNSRGESDAQRRCIKTILHTLTRLVQDSVLGMELLEQQQNMPSALFFKLTSSPSAPAHGQRQQQQLPLDMSASHDISLLARHLMQQQQKQQQQQQNQLSDELALPKEQQQRESEDDQARMQLEMHLQRQESYV